MSIEKDTKEAGEMNKNKLRATMLEHGDTQATLAEALGMSKSSLNAKINENGSEFHQTEIDGIRRRYNLTSQEVVDIFFCRKVS